MKIKKSTFSVVLGLVLVVGLVLAEMVWAVVPTAMVEKARDATVLVATQNENNQMGNGFGTGVLISETGIVLTNYHVIHRAEIIRVWFYDPTDSNYSFATVIGIDPVADLALLQLELDPDAPPPVYLEIEKETPVIAEPVVAIGHPVGLQWSVTTGSINHQARPGKITPYVNVIQHSAEINKGNSGGPLINANGDIVGINTYMLAPDGQWAGVAYAIRGDTVYASVEQMLEDGDVTYAAFKIRLLNLSEFLAKGIAKEYPDEEDIPNTFGLIAIGVEEKDHAYEQGVRSFDTFVAVEGFPINTLYDLKKIIKGYRPGDMVTVIYIRDSHFRLMNYELGQIEFDEYLDFYDKKMVDKFDKEAPKEEEQRPTPPPKRALIPPPEAEPEEEEEGLRPLPKPPQLEGDE